MSEYRFAQPNNPRQAKFQEELRRVDRLNIKKDRENNLNEGSIITLDGVGGIILTSPDGSQFRLGVTNAGALTATAV